MLTKQCTEEFKYNIPKRFLIYFDKYSFWSHMYLP